MKKKTTTSSGNVFVDLGFDQDEATVLQMRANLMGNLRLYIEKRKLTQAQAAKQLGMVQSRVSDLMRGKWDKFSIGNAHHARGANWAESAVELDDVSKFADFIIGTIDYMPHVRFLNYLPGNLNKVLC